MIPILLKEAFPAHKTKKRTYEQEIMKMDCEEDKEVKPDQERNLRPLSLDLRPQNSILQNSILNQKPEANLYLI